MTEYRIKEKFRGHTERFRRKFADLCARNGTLLVDATPADMRVFAGSMAGILDVGSCFDAFRHAQGWFKAGESVETVLHRAQEKLVSAVFSQVASKDIHEAHGWAHVVKFLSDPDNPELGED